MKANLETQEIFLSFHLLLSAELVTVEIVVLT